MSDGPRKSSDDPFAEYGGLDDGVEDLEDRDDEDQAVIMIRVMPRFPVHSWSKSSVCSRICEGRHEVDIQSKPGRCLYKTMCDSSSSIPDI